MFSSTLKKPNTAKSGEHSVLNIGSQRSCSHEAQTAGGKNSESKAQGISAQSKLSQHRGEKKLFY